MIIESLNKLVDKHENLFICGLLFLTCLFSVGIVLLISDFPTSVPWWGVLIGSVVLLEIIYWLIPTGKVKKSENTFMKTLKLKASCVFDVLFLIFLAQVCYSIFSRVTLEGFLAFLKGFGLFLLWIGGIAIGIFALFGLGWLWIKANEGKFKRAKARAQKK